jgi:MOSC domain-containing protein YiiM
MEKMIGPGAWWAMKDRGGVCGRVIEGGILRVGDEVNIDTNTEAQRKD